MRGNQHVMILIILEIPTRHGFFCMSTELRFYLLQAYPVCYRL